MKRSILSIIVALTLSVSAYADIRVLAIKGDVKVRHGTNEEWSAVSVDDVLNQEDAIRCGKKSSATVFVDGTTKLSLPEQVIVDIIDLRSLTQEELLLRLAMQDVRTVPTPGQRNEFKIPRTTTVHGTSKDESAPALVVPRETILLQLNGTKVLYDNGFYATCVLKAKDIFRFDPELLKRINIRLMVANALERMSLNGEALSEYMNVAKEQLTAQQRGEVESKIKQLKKQAEG